MKYLSALLAASALAAISTSSLAAKFTPRDTKFTLVGSMAVGQSINSVFNCSFSFNGLVTKAGATKIKKATFCAGVQPSGLPWTWEAIGTHPPSIAIPTSLIINGFNCGVFPQGGFDEAGTFRMTSQSSPNGCEISSGSGVSTPTIKVKAGS